MNIFVTCAQSIEPLLAQELGSLGYPQAVTGYRGVNISNVAFDDIYRINYLSRLAERVLLPIGRFSFHDAKSLYQGAGRINWLEYIPPSKTISIDVNGSHPAIRNTLFAAQVTKDAICDQLTKKTGQRPNVDVRNPDIQLNLFISKDRAIISYDTSGTPLHKRGYRQETSEAPMQETLAATLLYLADFKESDVFCDPCCGSGTLLIEAALMASKTPPGFLRTHWGFRYLPQYSNERWLKVKAEADSLRIDLPKGRIFGADIGKQAIHACKVNLRASGLHKVIEVVQSDIREYEPPTPPSIVMTNPPYGLRLGEMEQLKNLYRAIGDFMKRKTAKPSKGFVFTGSLELSKEVGLAPKRRHVLDNGGIEARLLEYDLY